MYKKIQINDFRLFHNQTILLGEYLTVLSGRNSTGKSTILGMIANSGELKKKDGVTYSSRAFRAEFSELFKGSLYPLKALHLNQMNTSDGLLTNIQAFCLCKVICKKLQTTP